MTLSHVCLWPAPSCSNPSSKDKKKATMSEGIAAFFKLAQEEGFEPPTSRLTAGCSTTELLLKRTGKHLPDLD